MSEKILANYQTMINMFLKNNLIDLQKFIGDISIDALVKIKAAITAGSMPAGVVAYKCNPVHILQMVPMGDIENELYFNNETPLYEHVYELLDKLENSTEIAIIKMRYFEGLTVDEIAVQLRTGPKTVYKKHSSAIKKLRDIANVQMNFKKAC